MSRIEEVTNPDDWGAGLRFGLGTLNTKKVTRANKMPGRVLLIALQHNLRKDNEGHRHRNPIDVARTAKNSVLRGADHPNAGNEVAHSIFDEFDIDTAMLRVDAIMGIEMVFQPPDGWDKHEFYNECLHWARMATSNSPTCGHSNSSRQDGGIIDHSCSVVSAMRAAASLSR